MNRCYNSNSRFIDYRVYSRFYSPLLYTAFLFKFVKTIFHNKISDNIRFNCVLQEIMKSWYLWCRRKIKFLKWLRADKEKKQKVPRKNNYRRRLRR